jgi:hypothetical protein
MIAYCDKCGKDVNTFCYCEKCFLDQGKICRLEALKEVRERLDDVRLFLCERCIKKSSNTGLIDTYCSFCHSRLMKVRKIIEELEGVEKK